MKIKLVAIDSVHEDPANLRVHSGHNLDAIKASLARFGQQKPIVVDSRGVIRAGNGTHAAAVALGWPKVAVTVSDLAGTDLVAYGIADNRTSELASWDEVALAETLRALQSEDYPLEDAGFTDAELDALLEGLAGRIDPGEYGDAPDPRPEIAKELRAKWATESGQLWAIPSRSVPGRDHRLLCGDSRVAADVARVMDGAVADVMFTDPPYGVDYTGKTRDRMKVNGDESAGLGRLLDETFANAIRCMRKGAAWYVATPAGPPHCIFANQLLALGILRQTLVWVKDEFVLGHSDYHYRHEPILYGWIPGASHREPADRSQDSVWEFPRPRASEMHPTMKPVALVEKAFLNSSAPGELAFEPFAGSGTSLLAAERTGRLCHALEIAPQYVAVILERMAEAGLEPHLAGSPPDRLLKGGKRVRAGT